jgi:hypothetical protein
MAITESRVGLAGWEVEVSHAMLTPPTFFGVPMMFFAVDALGTLFVAMMSTLVDPMAWLPVCIVGVGLYGIAYMGTQLEPHWPGMLWEYLSYAAHYEG